MSEQEPAPPLFGLKGGILCASVFLGGADLLPQELSWGNTKIFDALCLFPLRYEQSTEENSAPSKSCAHAACSYEHQQERMVLTQLSPNFSEPL